MSTEPPPMVAVRLLCNVSLDDQPLYPAGKVINLGLDEATVWCLAGLAERTQEEEQAS